MGTTEEPKGTQPTGEPPAGTKEPPQYTQKDVDLAVHKALSSAGRTEAQIQAREQAIQSHEEKVKRWQEEKDEADKKAADGNPELLDAINLRKQIRERETQLKTEKAELEKEKALHLSEIEEAKQTKAEILIFNIAQKHNVSADTLKQKAKRFKLESEEDIEEFAKTMGTSKILKPDSNILTGGVDKSTMTPDQKLKVGFSKK